MPFTKQKKSFQTLPSSKTQKFRKQKGENQQSKPFFAPNPLVMKELSHISSSASFLPAHKIDAAAGCKWAPWNLCVLLFAFFLFISRPSLLKKCEKRMQLCARVKSDTCTPAGPLLHRRPLHARGHPFHLDPSTAFCCLSACACVSTLSLYARDRLLSGWLPHRSAHQSLFVRRLMTRKQCTRRGAVSPNLADGDLSFSI